MKNLTYLFAAFLIVGCSVEPVETGSMDESLHMKGKAKNSPNEKLIFGIPTLTEGEITENTLEVIVTAGENGATGGLTLRWMTLEDFEAYGWDNDLAGHQNLKANPQHPEYELEEGETFSFKLANYLDEEDYLENATSYNRPLECGLSYMLIVQANQDGQSTKSDYSEPQLFSTAPCMEVCTYGKGHWRNHSNDNPGNQANLWPVSSLSLGSVAYSQDELNTILDANNSTGNGLIIFSQHLIAAKLNVANGAGNSEIAAAISEADDLIGDLVVLADAFTNDQKDGSKDLKTALEEFNESGNCED